MFDWAKLTYIIEDHYCLKLIRTTKHENRHLMNTAAFINHKTLRQNFRFLQPRLNSSLGVRKSLYTYILRVILHNINSFLLHLHIYIHIHLVPTPCPRTFTCQVNWSVSIKIVPAFEQRLDFFFVWFSTVQQLFQNFVNRPKIVLNYWIQM